VRELLRKENYNGVYSEYIAGVLSGRITKGCSFIFLMFYDVGTMTSIVTNVCSESVSMCVCEEL
jgi:hypothetical protein